ncbi:histidinol dehydrogenase [Woeseia oceani]|uniref:Histidinol dehydrogenase n=1 Tax=Woeseia oceani TaxID=1548547 RepID=A0A193LL44_9GAMM|nr:histidinol dehydrogenase [Woeseia oceani]ANO53138.1 histidinol dehydrogenase [Woeseia oceani]
MQVLVWRELDDEQRHNVLQRPALSIGPDIAEAAAAIIRQVRTNGDAALLELTARFDSAELTSLRVSADDFAAAEQALSAESINAIDVAIANVSRFHEAQRQAAIDVETMPGVRCERLTRPIDAVGLYVPAGTAPLPSAAIMLAVPARIAGCSRKALCTPPRPDGTADPAVLIAAQRAGVDEIYKVGGAQAIAALAFGTESIQPVDKIFGPGNAWVTAAKSQVSGIAGGVAIDMPAGPSEVLVIADEAANAAFVASDLLSQAEHGADSQVILLSTSEKLLADVREQLDQQLQKLARREIAAAALLNSRLIVCDDIEMAIAISNTYAPEHLILQFENARSTLPAISNAGSVFVGPWTPESVGDYCSGTNHVLPTYGAARNFSGLGLEQFCRQMTVQELTPDGLERLGPSVTELARLEGLDAHAAAVDIRIRNLTERKQ